MQVKSWIIPNIHDRFKLSSHSPHPNPNPMSTNSTPILILSIPTPFIPPPHPPFTLPVHKANFIPPHIGEFKYIGKVFLLNAMSLHKVLL